MKKIMKGLISLGVLLGLVGFGDKVEANSVDGFKNVPETTTLEAGNRFSTTQNIKLVENGIEKKYSVFLFKKSTGYKKVSNNHYINTKINGNYMIRYESANGKHKAWRRVIVKDTKAPMFSGINDVEIKYGSKFSTVKGITAYDLASGKRGFSVYYNGKKVGRNNYINTKKVGTHKLRYEVSDRNGLKTIAYRNVKVLPKAVKTGGRATPNVKANGRVHTIYPRLNDEKGFWYDSFYHARKFYVHSYAGENLNRFKKGDIVKFKIGNTNYKYIVFDKFVCLGDNASYPGAPAGKRYYASTRGRSMENDIAYAPVAMQTCYDNGYSKIKCVLLKPYGNSPTWRPR